MMSEPSTKSELIEQLVQVKDSLCQDVQSMSPDQFNQGNDESWSANGYLKHLILSVKPVAKAMSLPLPQLESMFGRAERPSRTYAEIVAAYKARIADGVRAEDYQNVTPTFYRLPEGVTDEKTYLTETWNESNQRVLDTLQKWEDADLDIYQLPHPAIGMTTVRETLFFTLYHNTLHWNDIQGAGGIQA